MPRAVALLAACVALAGGLLLANDEPRVARAGTGFWSDGWPACTWWGSTWFSAPTVGWARTDGPSGCVDRAVVRLQWYDGQAWQDTLLQYSAWGVNWIQYGGSPATSLVGTHQVYVAG